MSTATAQRTPTLAEIEAQQTKLAEMIAAIKTATPTIYGLPEAQIELAHGERYGGLMLDDEGEPSHHVILLPDAAADITWPDAIEWAKSVGGDLPTRREQSLLFANLKGQFEAAAYWSSEQYSDSGAFYQHFSLGSQHDNDKKAELRARVVRRFEPVRAACSGLFRLRAHQAQQRECPRIRSPPRAQSFRPIR